LRCPCCCSSAKFAAVCATANTFAHAKIARFCHTDADALNTISAASSRPLANMARIFMIGAPGGEFAMRIASVSMAR